MENTTSSPSTKPTPIILCGATTAVGSVVTSNIRPELEVLHFITSIPEATAQLPSLLAGHGPTTPSPNEIGTHDYTQPPRAVIFGRAFEVAQVKELVELCKGKGAVPVVWIVGDPSVEAPPGPPGPGYAEKAAESVKAAFRGWVDAGGKDGEVVYY